MRENDVLGAGAARKKAELREQYQQNVGAEYEWYWGIRREGDGYLEYTPGFRFFFNQSEVNALKAAGLSNQEI